MEIEAIDEAEEDKNTNFSHFIPSIELTELTWILIMWDTIIQGIGQPAGYDRISNWKCKNWYFHSEVSFTFGFPTPIWTFFPSHILALDISDISDFKIKG